LFGGKAGAAFSRMDFSTIKDASHFSGWSITIAVKNVAALLQRSKRG